MGRARKGAAKAASELLDVYTRLAQQGEHLLGRLLAGTQPTAWERLPADDAIDASGRYRWFYHSHAPEDRPAGSEHGHIHLFAQRALWEPLPETASARAFNELCGKPSSDAGTRHLVAIGIDAKGLPISLFVVNAWVTGDLMLDAQATSQLLGNVALDTGYAEIDRMIEAITRLCAEDIDVLLRQRDETLARHPSATVLQDERLEILGEAALDLDEKISQALA